MPVVYFNGGQEDEQAKGALLDNGLMRAFLVRRTDPTNMHSLGGHRIDDAPTYNISEGKISPEYKFLNGRNRVVEHQLSDDYVKSITFNLALPNRAVSVTDMAYAIQQNCIFDLFFVPEDCESGCDAFFWYAEDVKLGTKQIQNSIIGYDDNESPINMMRTARSSSQLKTYHGLHLEEFVEADFPLYSVFVLDQSQACQQCECPYQTIVRVGAGDTDAAPDAYYSEDGGATWTAIDTSAIAINMIITDVKYHNGMLVMTYSDVVDADGTDGGVAYSIGIGGALTDAVFDAATTGLQTLEILGANMYAFGTSGETFKSCDGGASWSQMTGSPITVTIIDSDVDSSQNVIFLACEDAEAWAFDGTTWTDLTANVNPSAAIDLISACVWRPGAIAFGGADGYLYENWDWSGLGTGAWVPTSFGAGTSVGALESDGEGYRCLAGVDNVIYERSIYRKQQWEVLDDTLTGDVTKIVAGYNLPDEGTNYFLATTSNATGELARVAKCDLCFETCDVVVAPE